MNRQLLRAGALCLMCLALTLTAISPATLPVYSAIAEAEYTIRYDANGGVGAPESQTKREGEFLTLSEETPTRSGYTFLGWTTILTAEFFEPGDLFFYDADTELVAVWSPSGGEAASYTISFDANGGTGAPSAQTKQQGVDLVLTTIQPTRSGCKFEGWSTSAQAEKPEYGSGDRFLKDADTKLYAVWSVEQSTSSFDVSRDAYAFNNSKAAFGYPSTAGKGANYPIAYDPPVKLLFGDTTAGKNFWRVAQTQGWGGNCCGMSTTAALLFAYSGISPSDFGADTAVNLKIGDTNGSMMVLTFIEAMQFAQKTPQFSAEWNANKVYNHQLSSGYSLNKLYNAVRDAAQRGRGTVLAILKEGVGGHAILAYDAEEVSDTQLRLSIYDCNFPKERRYMTLERKNASSDITGWAYDMGGKYGVWGTGDTGAVGYISFITYDTVEYIWTHRGHLYDNMELLSVDTDDFAIMDFMGNQVASVEDGVLSTARRDIHEVPNLSLNEADTVCLYLPKDYYTIQTPGNAQFEATMADYRLSATAQTTTGALSFAVDDKDLSNTVYIENATEDDNYWVSLESGYRNVQYSNVTVAGTGKGDNESICISGNRDTLSIANCNIESLSINGVEQITHTISAYAGAGGTISPTGDVKVAVNDEATFTFTPKPGYQVESVKVDGIDLGAMTEYTFQNNFRDHTIAVYFKKAYAIKDAAYDRAANTVTVDLDNEARCKLVCAVFDGDGAMRGAITRSVKANAGEAAVPLAGVTVADGGAIRVMLMNDKWVPLCKHYTITD